MIAVSHKLIPQLKRKFPKTAKLLAVTSGGDEAYYTTYIPKRRRDDETKSMKESEEEDDDDDDEMEDDEEDEGEEEVCSFTRTNWVPNFFDRMTMFIAGAPGAGKSYLAKEMIHLLPDDLDILLFTALDEKDGNFDDFPKSRLFKIKMTPEVLSKITLAEIRKRTKGSQCILLFDDVDKIRDPRVQSLTFAIMNDALANGRGHEKHNGEGDIHIICTSHSANDYQKTKYTFENSNYVALFPGVTPPLQLYRMFDKLGLDKKLCQKMMKLGRTQKIRSVIIHKVVPMYMIYGNKIMLI